MAKIYIGDILDWEQYTDKQTGEEKTAWKNYGWLFQDPETNKYSVKIMGKFFNVFPKRDNEAPKKATPKQEAEISIEDLPF